MVTDLICAVRVSGWNWNRVEGVAVRTAVLGPCAMGGVQYRGRAAGVELVAAVDGQDCMRSYALAADILGGRSCVADRNR